MSTLTQEQLETAFEDPSGFWNYRRVLIGTELGIREVYYDGTGKPYAVQGELAEASVELEVDAPQALKQVVEWFTRALTLPVLNGDTLQDIPEEELPKPKF